MEFKNVSKAMENNFHIPCGDNFKLVWDNELKIKIMKMKVQGVSNEVV
jgi:hypothetical protein